MNKLVLVIAMSFMSVMAFGQKVTDNYAGKWKTEEGVMVDITKSGSTFMGTAVEKKKVILENLRFDDNNWTATMIRPKDGTKVNATVTLNGNKMNIVVKKGLISKTLVWTKA
jgi:uncharacterized protein (DUF2147 family)